MRLDSLPGIQGPAWLTPSTLPDFISPFSSPLFVPQSVSVHRYCTGPTEVFPVFSTLPWLGFNRFKQLRTFFPATYYILSLHGKYQLLVTINTDLLNLTECIYIQQIHTNLFMPIENCPVGFTMNVFPSRDPLPFSRLYAYQSAGQGSFLGVGTRAQVSMTRLH